MIAGRLAGTLTQEQEAELDALLSSDSEAQALYNDYARIWNDASRLRRAAQIAAKRDEVWQNIENRTTKAGKVRMLTIALRVAAVLLPFAVLGMYWHLVLGGNGYQTFVTAMERDSIQLPDGSMVILNSNSRLDYKMDGTTRRVALTGIGYFRVEPDAEHPFVVSAGNAQITVLGTEFAVENIASRGRVSVGVESGRVEFAAGSAKAILHANDVAVLRHGAMELMHADDFSAEWVNGQIVLSNASLGMALEKVMEYYPHIAGIKGNADADTTVVTTRFSNQSLAEVLEELNIHFDKKIALDNGYLIISE